VSGRITLHLDKGLGWTKPLTVACCATCGAELARHPNQDRAIRAACRRRCPGCGTRTARRLPGTTSPATDLALSRGLAGAPGRQRRPLAHRPPLPHRPPTPDLVLVLFVPLEGVLSWLEATPG
jgi:hypothetical protein